MLKLPAVVVRVHAKKVFDAWIASFGLSNARAVSTELQKLLKKEKKRRRELESK